MKNFNPKTYKNKERIYVPVPKNISLSKLYVWNKDKKCYEAPERGKCYQAKRYQAQNDGPRKRVVQFFDKVDEARAWQHGVLEPENNIQIVPISPNIIEIKPSTTANNELTFGEIYQDFYKKKVSRLAESSRFNYDKYTSRYFGEVMPVPIRTINPQFIDKWIDYLYSTIGKTSQSKLRINFRHEFAVMRAILRFYRDYYEDALFQYPIKARHLEDCIVKKADPKNKDLTPEEFFLFREKLLKQSNGLILSALATVQFFEALRISEAAGVFHEDLNLNFKCPDESSIRICRHVIYPRTKGYAPHIAMGFKNAKGGVKSVKELPLLPESFEALKPLFKIGAKGLVFTNIDGSILTYRSIQNAYDKAFISAEMPYRGTHIMRHGGCRNVYNATGGDLAIAQQILGNSDMTSTLVYAQRDKAALKKHVKELWNFHNSKNAILEQAK